MKFVRYQTSYSTREPASVGCNNEQGDLFYSVGPHRNHVLATANTGKLLGEVLEKMQVNGPEV